MTKLHDIYCDATNRLLYVRVACSHLHTNAFQLLDHQKQNELSLIQTRIESIFFNIILYMTHSIHRHEQGHKNKTSLR